MQHFIPERRRVVRLSGTGRRAAAVQLIWDCCCESNRRTHGDRVKALTSVGGSLSPRK
jgi:hypothetical protein